MTGTRRFSSPGRLRRSIRGGFFMGRNHLIKGTNMSKYSKAIAALLGSLISLLVAFGLIEPALAESLKGLSEPLAGLIAMIAIGLIVERAPANKP